MVVLFLMDWYRTFFPGKTYFDPLYIWKKKYRVFVQNMSGGFFFFSKVTFCQHVNEGLALIVILQAGNLDRDTKSIEFVNDREARPHEKGSPLIYWQAEALMGRGWWINAKKKMHLGLLEKGFTEKIRDFSCKSNNWSELAREAICKHFLSVNGLLNVITNQDVFWRIWLYCNASASVWWIY